MPANKLTALTLTVLLASTIPALAGADGVIGNWSTPTGAVVSVVPCGSELCLIVAKVSPAAPTDHDVQNPDKSLQSRHLCGLRIGDGFKPDGPSAATGGHIYDPESGRTYNSKIERKGDTLRLRGYIGISLLGRTETWTTTQAPPPCN